MKLKTNKIFAKGPIKKKIKDQIGKYDISQIEFEWWNWKQIKLLQKSKKINKLKRIRTKVELSIIKRTTLKF